MTQRDATIQIRSLNPVEEDYAIRFVRLLPGFENSQRAISPEKLRRVFRALSREEELESAVRDKWGNWDWQYCEAHLEGLLYQPWVDQLLMDSLPDCKRPSVWPENRPFAICLTHDVDRVTQYSMPLHQVLRPALHAYRSHLGLTSTAYGLAVGLGRYLLQRTRLESSPRDPLWRYEDWLKLEESFGFRSTFFVFPSVVASPHQFDCTYDFEDRVVYDGRSMSVADMVKAIDAAGWEIGLHGSYNSIKDPKRLCDECRQVETVIGKPVCSVRQHYLRYEAESTPGIHEIVGLKADSSQGFNTLVGFRAGTSFPYWSWDHLNGKVTRVLQVPLAIMDSALLFQDVLAYNREFAIRHAVRLMDAVQKVGGCLTLNWHPQYIHLADYWDIYRILLAEAASRGAWGCSVQQLYEWWVAREKALLPADGCVL